MSLQKLANLLPKNITQLQANAQVEGAQVCRLWNDYAQQYFLKSILEKHEAINFRDGVLTIMVADPAIIYEIKVQKHKIVTQINHALNKRLVVSIRFRP